MDYQTLIAAIITLIAALTTAWIIYRSAKLPLIEESKHKAKERDRMLNFARAQLLIEMQNLRACIRVTKSIIQTVAAANVTLTDKTRGEAKLPISSVLCDWKFVSLFAVQSQIGMLEVKSQIEELNSKIERSGGAFGADSWQEHLINKLDDIRAGTATVINLSNSDPSAETKTPPA